MEQDISISNFSAKTIDGQDKALKDFANKRIMIVNTASKCGFTEQYRSLQKLWEKFEDQNFVILGFPCNQFANQEPKNEQEIKNFCEISYNVTFPMFAKVNVNGPSAHPLFKWLKKQAPGFLKTKSIKWNFTKFLIGVDGKSVLRYSPNVQPDKIDIFALD